MKTDLRILPAASGVLLSVENLLSCKTAAGANVLPLNTTPRTPRECLNAIEVIIMMIIVLNSLFSFFLAAELGCMVYCITCLGSLTHNSITILFLFAQFGKSTRG